MTYLDVTFFFTKNVDISKLNLLVDITKIQISVFQPFSSRGTFETLLNLFRQNLNTKNNANLRILVEPWLKNTDVNTSKLNLFIDINKIYFHRHFITSLLEKYFCILKFINVGNVIFPRFIEACNLKLGECH